MNGKFDMALPLHKHITLVFCCLLATSAFAANIEQPHLTVTGVSQINVKPDIAKISISVSTVKPTAITAKKAADDAVAKLIKRLSRLGVEKDDISSANLNLATEYRYPPKQERKLIGFRASRDILVTVNQLENVSQILDKAIESGANQVNGISFDIKNKQKYLEQARQQAISDAKTKALSLAKGFDTKIQGVWQIRYHSSQPSITPMFKGRMMMTEAEQADNGYQNSKVSFNDRVEVIFTLK